MIERQIIVRINVNPINNDFERLFTEVKVNWERFPLCATEIHEV